MIQESSPVEVEEQESTLSLSNIHASSIHSTQYRMPEAARLYAELKKQLQEKRLFEKQPQYYTKLVGMVMALLILFICLLFTIHNFTFQLFNAILLAFITTQLGLL